MKFRRIGQRKEFLYLVPTIEQRREVVKNWPSIYELCELLKNIEKTEKESSLNATEQ